MKSSSSRVTSDPHARLAIASESALFPPGPDPVDDPRVTAKALMVLCSSGWRGAAADPDLTLEPIDSDDAWRIYQTHRIEVERAFGVDPKRAIGMVAALRRRVEVVGLQMFHAVAGAHRVGSFGQLRVECANTTGHRLQEIDVFPRFQGMGYGNALLRIATERLRHADAQVVIIGADEDDWPLRWYRRHGFHDVARVPLTR